MRIVPEGPVSVFLGELAPGDLISFRGPAGKAMTDFCDGGDLVLMATGVGTAADFEGRAPLDRDPESAAVRAIGALAKSVTPAP